MGDNDYLLLDGVWGMYDERAGDCARMWDVVVVLVVVVVVVVCCCSLFLWLFVSFNLESERERVREIEIERGEQSYQSINQSQNLLDTRIITICRRVK